MPGLVLFLHGLMGDRGSWGAVPDYVRKLSLGSDFEIAPAEYSASIWSPSKIATSADQVLTRIRTKYSQHAPIFLVGYSLGGLIARELCRSLLINGPDDLLSQITACITLGTPLDGTTYFNTVLRHLPFVSKKIRELATPKHFFDSYSAAISVASKRAVKGPKQVHVRIEDDGVARSLDTRYFTRDDFPGGTIPGTHRNFANSEADAAYVAEVLVEQIRELHAISRPRIAKPNPAGNAVLPDQLILLACSHTKVPGGQAPFNGPPPAEWIPEPALRQSVLSKRTYVYGLLRDAKLADGIERGGNRAHQAANVGLKYGPDLGGGPLEGAGAEYLPASSRYDGRVYVSLSDAAWESLAKNLGNVRVLIMSGLYGLIEASEWIQNYDVHLTDTNDNNGQSVSSMWTDLYTDCITSYVRHAYRNRKVRIVDLLCDHHYVDSVRWHTLPKECSVFHLASPTLSDVDLLPPAGVIANRLLLDPDRIQGLRRDDEGAPYKISEFGDPPRNLADEEVLFESRVGMSKRNSE